MIKLPKPIKEQYYVDAKYKKLMLSSTDTLWLFYKISLTFFFIEIVVIETKE